MSGDGFRFGLSASRARPRSEWIALARRVESLGYDTLLMPDHFGPRFAAAPALVLAAEATERLRVGNLVYDNDFRHPALLAQEIATIDMLTEGRFDFGIGAGWLKSEYDGAGLPFDSGATRVARLRESLEIITKLLAGDAVTFAGEHYWLQGLTGAFPTIQRPHPPILIGGGGRRLLTLAAQYADIISVMPRSRADGSGLEDVDRSEAAFIQKLEWIKEAAGPRFRDIVLSTLVQVVTLTSDADSEVTRLAAEWKVPAAALAASPLILIGSVDEVAETLQHRRQRLGIGYITVFEKDIDAFARLIERIRR